MFGSFDSSGSPTIELAVFGRDKSDQRALTAVVDTGFTGFLLLPITTAISIGLTPHATTDITLADGATQNRFVCLGGINFEMEDRTGSFILEEQGVEALVGMEFLKSFGLTLILNAAAMTVQLVSGH